MRVMIVHADDGVAQATCISVRRHGHEAVYFTDPMAVLRSVEDGGEPDVLIAGVRFGRGKLHGVALGLMARRRLPQIKVLFIADPDDMEHAQEIGEVVPSRLNAGELADALEDLLRDGWRD